MGLDAGKPFFLGGGANNKGADQPAHIRSLISTCVIRLLERIISGLATSKNSIFKLVPEAEETGLSVALSETQRTSFLATRHNYKKNNYRCS